MIKRLYNRETQAMLETFGAHLARLLEGGCVVELVGDVGSGKTTLTKAIAAELGIKDTVHSPTFTISNRYATPSGLTLAHYDFYRLSDPGVMAQELAETLNDEQVITVIEWSGIVENILPKDRITIQLEPDSELTRRYSVEATGPKSVRVLEKL